MRTEYKLQWLQNIVSKVADVGVFGEKEPNHVLVNEYLSGQGIMVKYRVLLLVNY